MIITGEEKAGTEEKTEDVEPRMDDMVGYFSGMGRPHPISDAIQMLRENMLSLGFDEILTSYLLPLKDIKQLTGDLYPAFMDSIYHLSWIRLDPIPPRKEIEVRLMEEFPDLDRAELWNILDDIDEDTSGEELLNNISRELSIPMDDAITIMNLIPELRSGVPKGEDLTLRSFMPTSWISTIEATYDRDALPIRLFTATTSFRREPFLDSRHIRTYNILSLAVLDEEMNIQKGQMIMKKLFDTLELSDIRFVEKTYPFPYFTKGTELEMFSGELELGTCGLVSEEVLEERGINAPVFIADVGVERVLMSKHGYPDIRELFFPQFFSAWKLTDEEIAASIRYVRKPQTEYGKEIAQAILKCYRENRNDSKITRKVAWKGYLVESEYGKSLLSEDRATKLHLEGKPVEIVLKEARSGLGLAGPAAFNELWIKDGNITGVPDDMSAGMEESEAFKTNRTFVKGFSRLAAWKVEKTLGRGHASRKFENVRDLEGVNMKLNSKALHYILSNKKKIDIQGPVFLKFLFRMTDDNVH